MKFVSWNVNSLRSAEESFLDFIRSEQPEICFLQEVRAEPRELSMFLQLIPGYQTVFNPSGRAGYGGTAWYYKKGLDLKPPSTKTGLATLDTEGRTICAKMGNVAILSFYMPNGNRNEERLKCKLDFYRQVSKLVEKHLRLGHSIILGGDLNVAHQEIDLFAPRWNRNHSGFLDIERKWFSDLLALGLVDTFRHLEPGAGHYTWWHYRDPKRIQNNGWRFDYFLVSKDLLPKIIQSKVRRDVFGSDHAPIMLEVDVKS